MEDLKQKTKAIPTKKKKKKKERKEFSYVLGPLSLFFSFFFFSPLFFSIEPILMMKRVASSLKKKKEKIRFDIKRKKKGKKKWVFLKMAPSGTGLLDACLSGITAWAWSSRV